MRCDTLRSDIQTKLSPCTGAEKPSCCQPCVRALMCDSGDAIRQAKHIQVLPISQRPPLSTVHLSPTLSSVSESLLSSTHSVPRVSSAGWPALIHPPYLVRALHGLPASRRCRSRQVETSVSLTLGRAVGRATLSAIPTPSLSRGSSAAR